MTRKQHIISHPSQLNSLSVMPLAKVPGLGTIRLAGTFEQHPQKAELEARLNKQYRACGCDVSAKLFLIAGFGSAAIAAFQYADGAWSPGVCAAVIAGASVAGLILGKLAGLARANGRMKETVAEIQKLWIPEKGHREENAICG